MLTLTLDHFRPARRNAVSLQFMNQLMKWLAVLVFLGAGLGLAMAQAEPTIKQIYDTASSGKLNQAQTMVQQVIAAHPKSGKAHYVQAELFARQGELVKGREALLAAEQLAPGLAFAKPDAVQALRTQLTSKPGALPGLSAAGGNEVPANKSASRGFNNSNGYSNAGSGAGQSAAGSPAAPAASFSWPLVLLLGGAAVAGAVFFMRKKSPPAATGFSQGNGYNNPAGGMGGSNIGSAIGGGLNGPQTFGAGPQSTPGYAQNGQTPYGQPAQPGYPQPAASGMGGKIMGGVATGLAVGAGMMAAQAIGKTLTGGNEHNNANISGQPVAPTDPLAPNGYQPFAPNSDMGGQDFGVNNASSWDDGGSSNDGGGGDWDS